MFMMALLLAPTAVLAVTASLAMEALVEWAAMEAGARLVDGGTAFKC